MQLVATLIISLWFCGCKANKMAETLDLDSKIDDEYFRVDEENDQGVSYTRYTPKYGFIIAKVMQGYNFIWQRLSYKQECQYVDVYNRNKKPFLISMKVVKTNEETHLYFMNKISTWSPINFKEFQASKARDPEYSGPPVEEEKPEKKSSFVTVPIYYSMLITVLYSFYIIT